MSSKKKRESRNLRRLGIWNVTGGVFFSVKQLDLDNSPTLKKVKNSKRSRPARRAVKR